MKQEEEPWIDHLKQRVNEYEKPLPGNDWNHFQTEFFTPYLHKRRRMKTMRIAAVFFLIFIYLLPLLFIFYRQKYIKQPHLLYPYRHTSQEALQAALPLCLKTNCYRTGSNQRQLP